MYKFSTTTFLIICSIISLILCVKLSDIKDSIRKIEQIKNMQDSQLIKIHQILSNIEDQCKYIFDKQERIGSEMQKSGKYRLTSQLLVYFDIKTQQQGRQFSNISGQKQRMNLEYLCEVLTKGLNKNNGRQLIYSDSQGDLIKNQLKLTNVKFEQTILSLKNQSHHYRQLEGLNNSKPFCGYKCLQCEESQQCTICQPGYAVNSPSSQCQIQKSFHFLSIYLSFGFFLPFHHILMYFINQFAYYEYQYFMDGDLNNILMYVGNLHREKKLPLFFSSFFYQKATTKIQQLKLQLTNEMHTYCQQQKQLSLFLQKQDTIVHFLANTIQVYFFGIPVIVIIAILLKIFNLAIKKISPQTKFKLSYTSFPEIFYIFLFLYGQYLSFMFWKQIFFIILFDFAYKLNIVIAVIIMFILLIQTVAGYTIFITFWSQRYCMLFGQLKKHGNSRGFMCGVFLNPGYYVIMGSLQSLYILDIIKMNLFIILKISLLIIRFKYVKDSSRFFLNMKLFQSLNLIFCIFRCIGLYVIKISWIAEGIQQLILYSLCAFMVFEAFNMIIRYAFLFLGELKRKIEIRKGKTVDINTFKSSNYTIRVKMPIKNNKRDRIPGISF